MWRSRFLRRCSINCNGEHKTVGLDGIPCIHGGSTRSGRGGPSSASEREARHRQPTHAGKQRLRQASWARSLATKGKLRCSAAATYSIPRQAAHNYDYTVIELGAPSTRVGTLTKSSTLSGRFDDAESMPIGRWRRSTRNPDRSRAPANLGSLDPLLGLGCPLGSGDAGGNRRPSGWYRRGHQCGYRRRHAGRKRTPLRQPGFWRMEASRQTFAFPGDSGTLAGNVCSQDPLGAEPR